ncbi:MAG: ribose 5-phosphate isomerase B [Ignavibacteria bacterium]|nr:ribose 5-phosphate isomerase B [Ignavibacteria bacterium]
MNIAIGSDHAGFERKQEILKHLLSLGHEVQDLGTYSKDSMDYPDIAVEVALKVAQNQVERGILICGSGIGVSIVANKTEGVRAANCVNEEMAQLARQHNDANVLTLGERLVDKTTAINMVDIFLTTSFEGGRHEQRVSKIHDLTGR